MGTNPVHSADAISLWSGVERRYPANEGFRCNDLSWTAGSREGFGDSVGGRDPRSGARSPAASRLESHDDSGGDASPSENVRPSGNAGGPGAALPLLLRMTCANGVSDREAIVRIS